MNRGGDPSFLIGLVLGLALGAAVALIIDEAMESPGDRLQALADSTAARVESAADDAQARVPGAAEGVAQP